MACLTRKELFESISQWLDGSIGNYSFNNTEIKAIAILPDRQWGYDYPPDNWTTKGLEIVIIQPVPKTINILNRQLFKNYRWEIYLKNWEEDNSEPAGEIELIEASDLLANKLAENGYLFDSPKFILGNEQLSLNNYVHFIINDFCSH